MILARLINAWRHYFPAKAARERRARAKLARAAYHAARAKEIARAVANLPQINISLAWKKSGERV